jgi:hypothetical protein
VKRLARRMAWLAAFVVRVVCPGGPLRFHAHWAYRQNPFKSLE